MSYYRGDFYRGDWYRGDPGFFSTIANIGGAALGFLPGIGPVAQKVAQVVRGFGAGSSMVHTPIAAAAGKQNGLTSLVSKGVAAVRGHPILSAAGGAGLVAGGAGALVARGMGGSMVPGQKGYHMSKPRKGVAPHMVRNRRMNPCNPRALRRAIRRTHGFAKLAMRTIHIVHPKKRGRFGGFRRRRTRARS